MWIRRGVTQRSIVSAAGMAVAACAMAQDAPPEDAVERPVVDAQDPAEPPAASPPLRLDEILVTATQSPVTRFDAPYLTERLDSRLIGDRLYRTTPEALRDVPGIMVQKTSHGQGSPYIRGFTGFRTLMLVDGVRLNNSVFRDGPNQYWNTVDPLSLDRLEVVKGPSSVLYGSDAIGGTVAAFTKDPYSYREGLGLAGSLYYRYHSGEDSNIGRAEISASRDDDFGALLGLSVKDFGDVEAGSPTDEQPNTGYEEYDGDAKAEWWVSETSRLVFAYQQVRQNNVPRTHQTIFAVPFEGTTVGSDLRRDLDHERNLAYIQFHADELESFAESMSFNLSWHRQDEERDRIRSSGEQEFQGFEVNTIGLWGRASSETPIGRLTYGAEWYRDYVNSFSSRNPIQGPVADDATYDLVGVYLQDEIELGERLALVLGGRFNYASADADSVEDPVTGERISVSDDWSSLVGSGRLTYALAPERVNLFGGVSQGFRAPNLSDLTRLDTARTNEIETPSLGLDPEHFITYEAGVKTRGDWWSAQASYHYTTIDDLIIRTPTGEVIDGNNEVIKLNSDGGYVQGIEFGGSLHPHPQWTIFGQIAWLDGEVDTFPTSTADPVREPIDRLMPTNGQIGLRYDHPEHNVWVEGVLTLAADADDLSTRDMADTGRIPPGGTPGYEVFSIRSGWHLDDNVVVTLGFENIFDEDYRIHGSGQNEPGRSLAIGVELNF